MGRCLALARERRRTRSDHRSLEIVVARRLSAYSRNASGETRSVRSSASLYGGDPFEGTGDATTFELVLDHLAMGLLEGRFRVVFGSDP